MIELRKDFAIHDGKLCRRVERLPFVEYVEVKINEVKAPLLWSDKLIPWAMWQDICAFFRKSYANVKSESLCWLYFSQELHQWAWIVPHQLSSGMSVRVAPDERNTALRSSLHPSFIQIGSIHDHCGGSAFQSGTDHNDEIQFDGVHITLGKLDQRTLDHHTRVALGGKLHTSALFNWIECPSEMRIIPIDLRLEVFQKMILTAGTTTKVPKEILDRVAKPTFHQYNYGSLGPTTTFGTPLQIVPFYEEKIANKLFILADNGELWIESYAQHPRSRYAQGIKEWMLKFDQTLNGLTASDALAAEMFLESAAAYCEGRGGEFQKKCGAGEKSVASEAKQETAATPTTPPQQLQLSPVANQEGPANTGLNEDYTG